MRVYSAKRFSLLFLLSCIVGIAVAVLTISCFDIILPNPRIRAYEILVNYDEASGKPLADVRLNHTIIVMSDNTTIESILTVTRRNDWHPDVEIEMLLGTASTLIPRLLEGNLTWSGQIYSNQSRTLKIRLALDADGTYYIGSQAVSYSLSDDSGEGSTTTYYVTVQEGRITKVADKNGMELVPHAQMATY